MTSKGVTEGISREVNRTVGNLSPDFSSGVCSRGVRGGWRARRPRAAVAARRSGACAPGVAPSPPCLRAARRAAPWPRRARRPPARPPRHPPPPPPAPPPPRPPPPPPRPPPTPRPARPTPPATPPPPPPPPPPPRALQRDRKQLPAPAAATGPGSCRRTVPSRLTIPEIICTPSPRPRRLGCRRTAAPVPHQARRQHAAARAHRRGRQPVRRGGGGACRRASTLARWLPRRLREPVAGMPAGRGTVKRSSTSRPMRR